MAHKSQEEITKSISAPLSSNPLTRQKQKVKRKALVLHKKGFKPKRKAQVLKSKSTPKIIEKKTSRGGVLGLMDKLRDRFPK